MALLARLFDFQPATTIVSADVDSEFNQLVNILNGTSTNKDALIKFSDATNPVLRVDQIGAGAIQQWLQNGTEKVSIRNNGALRINSTQAAADPLKLAISSDANNLGNIVASIQTVGVSDQAMRLAMEGATSGGIPALTITRFDGAAVQTYFRAALNGETEVAAGHPSSTASLVTKRITLGGQYSQSLASVGNVGAGEDDLHSYTIPANVLANDGDSLDFIGGGTILAAGTTKRLRFYFGGTVFFDTGLIDPSVDETFGFHVTIIRIDADSVVIPTIFGDQLQIVGGGQLNQINGLTFTSSIVLKITGQDTDGVDNRIRIDVSCVRKFGKNST